ncbi:MAG: hypothetical protein O7J95_20945 [Planctomycetota bacterium]|nr:hypothetical protein [Planctomycetota bacterium]
MTGKLVVRQLRTLRILDPETGSCRLEMACLHGRVKWVAASGTISIKAAVSDLDPNHEAFISALRTSSPSIDLESVTESEDRDDQTTLFKRFRPESVELQSSTVSPDRPPVWRYLIQGNADNAYTVP